MPESTPFTITFSVKPPTASLHIPLSGSQFRRRPSVNSLRLRTRLRILAGWPVAVGMALIAALRDRRRP